MFAPPIKATVKGLGLAKSAGEAVEAQGALDAVRKASEEENKIIATGNQLGLSVEQVIAFLKLHHDGTPMAQIEAAMKAAAGSK